MCRGGLLHANVIGCGIFAAVSGSSAATCATIGKITLPELKQRGYPDAISMGSLAGAGTFGLLIPPSIIMIVYGGGHRRVDRASSSLPAWCRGMLLMAIFSGYLMLWAWRHPTQIPAADTHEHLRAQAGRRAPPAARWCR